MNSSRGKTKQKESADSGSDPENRAEEKASGRKGLPDENSILVEKEFESPSGRKYRILKTTEMDEYEEPPQVSSPKDEGKR